MVDASITTTELASRIDIPTRTLRRWARAGKIPSSKQLGGHYRFNLDAVLFAIKEAVDAQDDA